MIVLGLTGSIGMGKSTVAQMFRDRGVPVHSADDAVHRLLTVGGAAVAPVGSLFPSAVARDDQGQPFIDRKRLGALVFADTTARQELEKILHPLVRQDSDRFVAAQRALGVPLVVLDIPLLFETGGEKRVDKILCVTAPPEVQRARVMARPNMTVEKFEQIKAAQLPDDDKRRRSHFVIDTSQSLEKTTQAVAQMIQELRKGPHAPSYP